mmetsp:Transcript_3073/g.8500  ORF Transcript_3073/g.8500 Transcript_3073/m.8500 type:complete len:233 (+) Transcript_3073:1106-1804(+)
MRDVHEIPRLRACSRFGVLWQYCFHSQCRRRRRCRLWCRLLCRLWCRLWCRCRSCLRWYQPRCRSRCYSRCRHCRRDCRCHQFRCCRYRCRFCRHRCQCERRQRALKDIREARCSTDCWRGGGARPPALACGGALRAVKPGTHSVVRKTSAAQSAKLRRHRVPHGAPRCLVRRALRPKTCAPAVHTLSPRTVCPTAASAPHLRARVWLHGLRDAPRSTLMRPQAVRPHAPQT